MVVGYHHFRKPPYAGSIFFAKLPIKVVGISYCPGPGVLDTTIFALCQSKAQKPKNREGMAMASKN